MAEAGAAGGQQEQPALPAASAEDIEAGVDKKASAASHSAAVVQTSLNADTLKHVSQTAPGGLYAFLWLLLTIPKHMLVLPMLPFRVLLRSSKRASSAEAPLEANAGAPTVVVHSPDEPNSATADQSSTSIADGQAEAAAPSAVGMPTPSLMLTPVQTPAPRLHQPESDLSRLGSRESGFGGSDSTLSYAQASSISPADEAFTPDRVVRTAQRGRRRSQRTPPPPPPPNAPPSVPPMPAMQCSAQWAAEGSDSERSQHERKKRYRRRSHGKRLWGVPHRRNRPGDASESGDSTHSSELSSVSGRRGGGRGRRGSSCSDSYDESASQSEDVESESDESYVSGSSTCSERRLGDGSERERRLLRGASRRSRASPRREHRRRRSSLGDDSDSRSSRTSSQTASASRSSNSESSPDVGRRSSRRLRASRWSLWPFTSASDDRGRRRSESEGESVGESGSAYDERSDDGSGDMRRRRRRRSSIDSGTPVRRGSSQRMVDLARLGTGALRTARCAPPEDLVERCLGQRGGSADGSAIGIGSAMVSGMGSGPVVGQCSALGRGGGDVVFPPQQLGADACATLAQAPPPLLGQSSHAPNPLSPETVSLSNASCVTPAAGRRKRLVDWDVEDVAEWLEAIGLAQYRDDFTKHDINGAALAHLGREDLGELGVKSIGHKLAILRARDERL